MKKIYRSPNGVQLLDLGVKAARQNEWYGEWQRSWKIDMFDDSE